MLMSVKEKVAFGQVQASEPVERKKRASRIILWLISKHPASRVNDRKREANKATNDGKPAPFFQFQTLKEESESCLWTNRTRHCWVMWHHRTQKWKRQHHGTKTSAIIWDGMLKMLHMVLRYAKIHSLLGGSWDPQLPNLEAVQEHSDGPKIIDGRRL